ncbi:MAG: hypothetical protein ACYC1M_15385 [Armatimonadota bacterium]
MSMAVVLQDERHQNISEMVFDTEGAMAACLRGCGDKPSYCLRFIDPYGDTIFNPLQARVLLSEWDGLLACFRENHAEALWRTLRFMILSCSENPHTYLRFIGE